MRFRYTPFRLELSLLILFLTSFGILVIYGSSPKLATQQLVFAVLGFGIFLVLGKIDYRIYKSIANYGYLFSLVLLILVIFIGVEIRGATRWFDLGFFRLQPSELVKPILILMVANLLSLNESVNFRGFIFSLGSVILPVLLVMKQPDIGTGIVLIMIWFSIILVSNIKWWYVFGLISAFILLMPISYKMLAPYQKERITAFFNPSHDPLGISYSVIQSQIAIGSGQLFGRGFGRGTQSHLNFLPEFNTDFIFAALSEEFGLVGSSIIIGVFALIIFRLLNLLKNISDPFGRNILVGIIGVFTTHFVINVGMNLGILPVTGITLPFISYGGSSLISMFILFGLVVSVERFNNRLTG